MFLTRGAPPTLAIRRPSEFTLEFEHAFPYGEQDPYVDGLLVRAVSSNVQIEHSVRLLAGDQLPAFLSQLAGDFRGWTGQRTWQSLNFLSGTATSALAPVRAERQSLRAERQSSA